MLFLVGPFGADVGEPRLWVGTHSAAGDLDYESAGGGGTDGAPASSASSASSVDLATISSSSLACKASADPNFLSHPPTSRKWVGTEGLVLVDYSV